MKLSRLLLALLALACSAVLVAACGDDDDEQPASTSTPSQSDSGGGGKIQRDEANADVQLTIGSKNFTEQKVLGEIYAQGLEAAGFKVSKDLNLGDEKTALAAVKSGEISGYPEYTGTALLSFFGKKADELPKDEMEAYEEARKGFEAEGLVALPPTPFTSSNEVAVTQETADKLGLKTISDLEGKSQDLVLYGSPECRQRLDCLLGLEQVYGLKFKKFVPVAIDQRHEVLSSGRADVSIVFTTDPQIQREQEVLLEDDKGMFPPYNSTLVLRKDVADKGGESLTKTVKLIQDQLTDENMQELNARVDLDKKDPATVAEEYLNETGLIGK
jgi:osmoprotectant transport system substrate-binding protein